jgi:hypothetical protein
MQTKLKRCALVMLMTPLMACSQPQAHFCPMRLHMPQSLKVKLKTLPLEDADKDYLKDLYVQQLQLRTQ